MDVQVWWQIKWCGKFCEKNGIVFYTVNHSFPEEYFQNDSNRKIHADLFIDDRNIGGFPWWGEIYQMLTNETPKIPEKKKAFSVIYSNKS